MSFLSKFFKSAVFSTPLDLLARRVYMHFGCCPLILENRAAEAEDRFHVTLGDLSVYAVSAIGARTLLQGRGRSPEMALNHFMEQTNLALELVVIRDMTGEERKVPRFAASDDFTGSEVTKPGQSHPAGFSEPSHYIR